MTKVEKRKQLSREKFPNLAGIRREKHGVHTTLEISGGLFDLDKVLKTLKRGTSEEYNIIVNLGHPRR
jgi:hypothetical protein